MPTPKSWKTIGFAKYNIKQRLQKSLVTAIIPVLQTKKEQKCFENTEVIKLGNLRLGVTYKLLRAIYMN